MPWAAPWSATTRSRAQSYVDQVTLPADSKFPPALANFFELLGRPGRAVRALPDDGTGDRGADQGIHGRDVLTGR